MGAGRKTKKGLFYVIKSISDEDTVLECGEIELHMPLEEVVRSCRLSHALTLASCQGLTLTGRVRVCDTDNPHFTTQHLYIGASGATSNELLEVC